MLVIEIDGAIHETEKEVNYDKERQKYLEELGIKVKRYTNIDIKDSLEEVLLDLMDEIKTEY